ncbi:MAG: CHASE domain-containing protein [Candidatus Synoicihabitans palmerolidicus]|nr:CHASE domain-containing protein [Candidatus Synoicihabitans palmerolidicus]
MLGALLLGPFLQAAKDFVPREVKVTRGEVSRGLAVLGASIAVGLGVFSYRSSGGLIFAVFPLLLLGAWWRGRLGARILAVGIAMTAIATAANRAGPFVSGDFDASFLRLHGILICVTLSGLMLPLFRLRRDRRLLHVVLLAGWLASGGVYHFQQVLVAKADQAHLEDEVTNAQSAIEQRMFVYTEALRAGEALFNTMGTVDRAQWRSFVQTMRLQQLFPDINGIGVIWPVSGEGSTRFEETMAAGGSAGFRIKAVPAVTAPEGRAGDVKHFVIGYIEPEDINLQAIGLDVGSESNRRRAAIRARDTGAPQMMKRIELVQDGQKGPDFFWIYQFTIRGCRWRQ